MQIRGSNGESAPKDRMHTWGADPELLALRIPAVVPASTKDLAKRAAVAEGRKACAHAAPLRTSSYPWGELRNDPPIMATWTASNRLLRTYARRFLKAEALSGHRVLGLALGCGPPEFWALWPRLIR
jgi:hypothetical protein